MTTILPPPRDATTSQRLRFYSPPASRPRTHRISSVLTIGFVAAAVSVGFSLGVSGPTTSPVLPAAAPAASAQSTPASPAQDPRTFTDQGRGGDQGGRRR